MPTFDGPNLLIILDSGVTNVDVEVDLYSDWKEWKLLSDNAKFPDAFRTIGGDPLTPGVDAGAYFFIQNQNGWRIRPAEEDATVLVTGNLAPEDSTLPIMVPTLGNFTVLIDGLQPVTQNVDTILTQTQESLYGGVVTIDTVNGTVGTTFPIGTKSEPVLTLADAEIIAANIGVREIEFAGNITLMNSMVGWVISGRSAVATLNLNGQDVDRSFISRCTVTGNLPNLTDGVVLKRCTVGASGVTNFLGSMVSCDIIGDVSLQQGAFVMTNCVSGVVTGVPPAFDSQSNLVTMSIQNYTGDIELQNQTNPSSTTTIDALSGNIIINANNTNGIITIRGLGLLENNSTGVTVDSSGLIEPDEWKLAVKITRNKIITDPVAGTITVYDNDDTTILLTANLSEDAAGTQPYRGQGAERRERLT